MIQNKHITLEEYEKINQKYKISEQREDIHVTP
jgi:hypothetical protein